jgi:hypothetical protein
MFICNTDLKFMLAMVDNERNEAVYDIVTAHKEGDAAVDKAIKQYQKLDRMVDMGLKMLVDAKLDKWDWKWLASHGWLCELDFEWFKKELDEEKITKDDYLANWEKWKEEWDKKCPECGGHGGTYTVDNMGQPMGVVCETCRDKKI